jgi:hypothetical protein
MNVPPATGFEFDISEPHFEHVNVSTQYALKNV